MVIAPLTAFADHGKIDISVAADTAAVLKADDPTFAALDSDYSPKARSSDYHA